MRRGEEKRGEESTQVIINEIFSVGYSDKDVIYKWGEDVVMMEDHSMRTIEYSGWNVTLVSLENPILELLSGNLFI